MDVDYLVVSLHLYSDRSCRLGQKEFSLLIDWLRARKTCLSPEHHVIIWWRRVVLRCYGHAALHTESCCNADICESNHSVTEM